MVLCYYFYSILNSAAIYHFLFTVKFHFLVNPILTGSIVIEQWIEFGFEMVITVRFQYNANVVHQTVVM